MFGPSRLVLVASWTLIAAGGAAMGAAAASSGGASYLLDLPGEPVSVRYSPGSLERAVQVQERFEPMVRELKSWTRQTVGLVVFLLNREDWEQERYAVPYGLPVSRGGRALAMGAWGDDGTVELWKELLGTRLPTVPEQSFRGSSEQASSMAAGDLMAVVEAARILTSAAGVRGDQAWVEGVLAHVVALTVLQKLEPGRLLEASDVFASLVQRGGGAAAYPLRAAEAPPSLRARLWFEGQYFTAARRLADAAGKQPAKTLLKQARQDGGVVRGAELLERFPTLAEWLHTGFGAE